MSSTRRTLNLNLDFTGNFPVDKTDQEIMDDIQWALIDSYGKPVTIEVKLTNKNSNVEYKG